MAPIKKRKFSPPDAETFRVMLSCERIAQVVRDLAEQINAAYHGGELTVLAILDGSLVFLADLIRHLQVPLKVELISAKSYIGKTTHPTDIPIYGEIPRGLSGKNVLLLDDILDGGQTLSLLVKEVSSHNPSSIRTCVLLRKTGGCFDADRPAPDFVGFDISDKFVVGYGMDYDGYYRNLPDIRLFSSDSREAEETQ